MKNMIFFLIFCFGFNSHADVKADQSSDKTKEVEQKAVDKKKTGDEKTDQTTDHQVKETEVKTMDNKMVETQKKPLFRQHVITGNLGMNMSAIKEIEEPGYGLMLGGKYSFYFSSKVGVFIGLDYIQRNASENNWDVKMTSIDIPFGLTFRYRNWFDALGATFLGLYYNMPQSGGKIEYSGSYAPFKGESVDLEGENHLGFLLHSETYFEVAENFNLGFFGGLKIGFGDYITKWGENDQSDKNNTLDVTFGLAAKF